VSGLERQRVSSQAHDRACEAVSVLQRKLVSGERRRDERHGNEEKAGNSQRFHIGPILRREPSPEPLPLYLL
jgi:hypothetical protein